MKLDEFERKLASVADDKLLKMLRAARLDGPDVAAKLIEAEAARRGLDLPEKASSDSGATQEPGASDPGFSEASSSPDADARVRSAFAGLDRPLAAEGSDMRLDFSAAEPASQPAPAASPSPGAWLNDEMSKSRVPIAVKVVFYLGALGGLVAVLFKFLQKH
jgi:hypothetical protein